ncbi:MAG: SRPBCC domain-containing protein [Thermodesulfobacteriales bacterium]
MKYMLSALMLLFVLASVQDSFSEVTNKQMSAQVFEGEVIVNAPAEKVWAVLTNLEQFAGFMGFQWQSGNKTVSKVGDTARMKVWSDNATYFLTYADPNKELRLALEPDNASYICQKRWILTPQGDKTKVQLIDIYTESSPQSEESINSQIEGWNGHLAKLKEMAEGS